MKKYFTITLACSLFLILSPAVTYAETNIAQYEPVVCKYETRIVELADDPKSSNHRWYFWRTTNKVETQAEDGTASEIWQRDTGNNISMQRLFHKQQRIIEYSPSDLRSLGRYPAWEQRAQLINPHLLSKLKHTGTTVVHGYKAQRYQGKLSGVDLEVLWLDKFRLPALVRRVTAAHKVSVRLLNLYSLDDSPWHKIEHSEYQTMDFSDIGDNESDPFIANLSHNDANKKGTHSH